MPYVKAWCGADDGDVLEIVEAIEAGERSAWIRNAIREKAGRQPHGSTAGSVDLSPITNELHRIVTLMEPLLRSRVTMVPADEDVAEDPAAAGRLNSMF